MPSSPEPTPESDSDPDPNSGPVSDPPPRRRPYWLEDPHWDEEIIAEKEIESSDEDESYEPKNATSGCTLWLLASIVSPFLLMLALNTKKLDPTVFLTSLTFILVFILFASTFMAGQLTGRSGNKTVGMALLLTIVGGVVAFFAASIGCSAGPKGF